MTKPGHPSPHNPHPAPRFELVTLGSVALVGPTGELVLQKSKLLAILTWILASPKKTATRSQLATMFWGDSSPERAGRALRTSLYRIRAVLGDTAPETSGPDVHLSVPVTMDTEVFVSALEAGDLATAIATYTGPFFAEYSDAGTADFEHWVDLERERLEGLYLRAADALVRRCLDSGRMREGVEIARQVRRVAPGAELGWRLLLEALMAHGERFAARIEAEAFAKWLSQQERVPDAASSRLLEAVRGQPLETPGEAHPDGFVAELVGREREFAAIMGAWNAAEKGQARHLHLSSPAGFGKTRLLEEVARRLRTLNGRVVSIRATPGERDVGYALAAALARALAELPGAAGVPPDSMRVLVALQPALSARYPGPAPAPAGPDLALQRAQALGELVGAVAEEGPVAIQVDDLHWADPESRRILRALSDRLDGRRVLLLTAARPGYGDLGGHAEVFPLPALTLAEIELLLASAGTCPAPGWAGRMAQALHRASGGSPLLILNALRRACERGELSLEGGVWSSPDFEALLTRLEQEDRLEARLASLDPADRRLLLLLAVAGTPWTVEDLSTLSGASPLDVRTRFGTMERLGYLALTERGWDLVNEDVAATLLDCGDPEEIRSAHLGIGCFLAARPSDRVIAARAARHLAAAGAGHDLLKVVEKELSAARRAGDRSPVDELVRNLLGNENLDWVPGIVGALPWNVRFRLRPIAVAAGVAALLLGTFTLTRVVAGRRPAVEATLVLLGSKPGERTLHLTRLPVSRAALASSEPLDPEAGSGPVPFDELQGMVDAAPSPDGLRIAFTRITGDSGVTDLFLREPDGVVRRLTSSRDDDVNPTWSPDGRYLAFQTLRWNPAGEFDLAILDLANGAVRQLTGSGDGDTQPRWSPDGSRIAFIRQRREDGIRVLCWVSFDGRQEHCLDKLPWRLADLGGWRDAEQVVVGTLAEEQQPGPLLSLRLRTSEYTVIGTAADGARFCVSPDGEWVAVGAADSVVVFRIDEPGRRRTLFTRMGRVWFEPPAARADRPVLRISPLARGTVGVPVSLSVERGRHPAMNFPREMLDWRSEDTTIATVLSDTGLLLPRRAGTVRIVVSAGGWRSDSLEFTAGDPWSRSLFQERWTDSALARWERFGDPSPRVVATPEGNAFFTNGDHTFESGVVTRSEFPADSGIGFEARVKLPITETKWQMLQMAIGEFRGIVPAGGVGVGPCALRLPAGEGRALMNRALMNSQRAGLERPARFGDGAWHRVRIQIFRDRSCGYALDGIALAQSLPMPGPRGPARLSISGQSVGTMILVGPLEIWEGVRTDVNWAQLVRR